MAGSFDNLRLWDLEADLHGGQWGEGVGGSGAGASGGGGGDKEVAGKRKGRAAVPFEIVPGHHGGVVSRVWVDRSCGYLISCGGNRGWEGTTTEVWLGSEVGFVP